MSADDCDKFKFDLAQVVRLALGEKTEDVRLFVAKMVRHYRGGEPHLAEELAGFLRSNAPKTAPSVMRKGRPAEEPIHGGSPMDGDSQLALLKTFANDVFKAKPLLSDEVDTTLDLLIKERRQTDALALRGLDPTKSAVFVGAPGVGKTITARWIAAQLGLPLFVLDLSAVMSSYLGRSGANLRAALDYAKRIPCVLLLDELDAIAKRRSDESDIGELKRLVTVILQEVDEWPASGLLLAATNHPELIDPALWRRFDLIVEFGSPNAAAVDAAVERFLGPDLELFREWLEVLSYTFQGESFSDIERLVLRLRRGLIIGDGIVESLIADLAKSKCAKLDRSAQLDFALLLESHTSFSQRRISEITGVSRDTIRKHRPNAQVASGRPSRKR
ncbi:ATPase [Pseudomonas brassicacearum]|uniref:AAA family ATPase n=1 Tax=Pseudomonas brassicacearum TaxID=930166 RepID=UPI000F475D17|nr:ATP-binding protein [Pseudomonas brassicacearum]ROM69244.1 ATPase [Pseudomonas brassicacearum]